MNNTSTTLILDKLNAALQADSDFPTRAQIITELRKKTSNIDSRVDQIVELVMCEPSLATRLLHLTNSVYYARGTEITTLSQAITQLGLKGVYNLCANFVLLQKFSALTEKSSAFANCFLFSILTSNIASFIDSKDPTSKDEEGYLAGSLFSMGPLLLGYYFPKLFSDAEKRADRKKIGIFKGVEEILGMSAVGVSVEIVNSLSVPEIYHTILNEAFSLFKDGKYKNTIPSSKSVCIGAKIAIEIIEAKSANELKRGVEKIEKEYLIPYSELYQYLTKLPSIVHTQKTLLDSASCNFPESFVKFIKSEFEDDHCTSSNNDSLSPYISQIESAIIESETLPSIIATAMEALSYACDFKRVVYLEADMKGRNLYGKLSLGDDIPDTDSIIEDITSTQARFSEKAHLKAYFGGMVEYMGKPLLDDAWPFIAIPVGYEDRSLGVIYADRCEKEKNGFSAERALSFTLISDLLDTAIEKSRL